jgi:hypothetical protein
MSSEVEQYVEEDFKEKGFTDDNDWKVSIGILLMDTSKYICSGFSRRHEKK